MVEFWWPLLWTVAGLPILSVRTKYSLLRKRVIDYAYYLEWKEFSVRKFAAIKIMTFASVGVALTLLALPLERMLIAFVVVAACGSTLESTLVIGRAHPTPKSRSTKVACEGCKQNDHDSCTNVRMLDSFETGFKSKDGALRPVCCCGFRISILRELTI